MSVALNLENPRLQEHECVAIVATTLYDREAMELLLKTQNKLKFTGRNSVRFMLNLAAQERIEKSAKQNLEVSVQVEVQISSEDRADSYCP